MKVKTCRALTGEDAGSAKVFCWKLRKSDRDDMVSSYRDLDPAIGKGDGEDDEGGGHAEDDDVGQGRLHGVLTLPLPCNLPVPAFHHLTWSESVTAQRLL